MEIITIMLIISKKISHNVKEFSTQIFWNVLMSRYTKFSIRYMSISNVLNDEFVRYLNEIDKHTR